VLTLDQRKARAGKLTASRAHDILVGRPKSLRRILADIRHEAAILAAGEVPPEVNSAATRWGNEWEDTARTEYQIRTSYDAEAGGFHVLGADPLGSLVGASPDGLVGVSGVLEIKCGMSPNTHVSYIANGPSARAHAQMQFQMWCTGRRWAHFVSFDPRHPDATRLYVQRVPRDEFFIEKMAEKVLSLAEHLMNGTEGPADIDNNEINLFPAEGE